MLQWIFHSSWWLFDSEGSWSVGLFRVAKEEEHNKMSPSSLAIVFAPCILRSPDVNDPFLGMNDVSKTTLWVRLHTSITLYSRRFIICISLFLASFTILFVFLDMDCFYGDIFIFDHVVCRCVEILITEQFRRYNEKMQNIQELEYAEAMAVNQLRLRRQNTVRKNYNAKGRCIMK